MIYGDLLVLGISSEKLKGMEVNELWNKRLLGKGRNLVL